MPNFSRRNVVQTAALVPFQAINSSAQNSAIKVGLIGAGNRGAYTATAIAKDPRVKVVAICDVVEDTITAARKRIGNPDAKGYKNYQDVLASDVDAVMIATPVYLHPDHFEAAVKSGKHIYMEKPAGLDVAGCKRVMKAADSANRKQNITFGFQQRYGGVYVKAKQFLESGAIGKVREVHGEFLKFALQGRRAHSPDAAQRQGKAGTVEALALHLRRSDRRDLRSQPGCDQLVPWRPPTKALGTGGRTVEKRGDLLDHLSVTYDYPDKVQMTFIGSQMTPKYFRSNRERYIGDNGFIETAREYWTYNTGAGPVTEKSGHEITVDALTEFVNRLSEGKPENVGVRAAESTLTSILGQMAIDRKREVTWDEMMRSA